MGDNKQSALSQTRPDRPLAKAYGDVKMLNQVLSLDIWRGI